MLKAIERIGGRVEVRPIGGLGRHQTFAVFCGESVPFRLRERYGQESKSADRSNSLFATRREYLPTGEFIIDRGRDYIDRAYTRDTADRRVENRVNEILVALVTEAGARRVAQRAREAKAKRQEEEARLRREQAEREAAERDRVEKMLTDAEAWRRADTPRGFIKAVEDLALAKKVNSGEGTELAVWLMWARQQAEALDPVARTLGRLTGKSAQ
jgi:hypothetical protein